MAEKKRSLGSDGEEEETEHIEVPGMDPPLGLVDEEKKAIVFGFRDIFKVFSYNEYTGEFSLGTGKRL